MHERHHGATTKLLRSMRDELGHPELSVWRDECAVVGQPRARKLTEIAPRGGVCLYRIPYTVGCALSRQMKPMDVRYVR